MKCKYKKLYEEKSLEEKRRLKFMIPFDCDMSGLQTPVCRVRSDFTRDDWARSGICDALRHCCNDRIKSP